MKIQVLGCSAVELPHANLPSFLVDNKLLLDAGTIGSVLDQNEQWKIRNVLLTHAHVDHIKDLPFLADNISVSNKKHHVTVISIPKITRALKKHLFNDILWPDFTKIPTADNPIIKLKNIHPGKVYSIDGYQIISFKVKHTVPAVGYLIEDNEDKSVLYIGDTGPGDTLWKSLEKKLNLLIIEVSLPNRFTKRALETGHLTPRLLASEIEKMKYMPDVISITHCKPQHKLSIKDELKKLSIRNIKILKDGEHIVI